MLVVVVVSKHNVYHAYLAMYDVSHVAYERVLECVVPVDVLLYMTIHASEVWCMYDCMKLRNMDV